MLDVLEQVRPLSSKFEIALSAVLELCDVEALRGVMRAAERQEVSPSLGIQLLLQQVDQRANAAVTAGGPRGDIFLSLEMTSLRTLMSLELTPVASRHKVAVVCSAVPDLVNVSVIQCIRRSGMTVHHYDLNEVLETTENLRLLPRCDYLIISKGQSPVSSMQIRKLRNALPGGDGVRPQCLVLEKARLPVKTPLAEQLDLALGFLGLKQVLLLTAREIEIMRCVSQGCTNAQVGALLGITEATVKTHLQRTYKKLGVSDRAAAVAIAASQDWL